MDKWKDKSVLSWNRADQLAISTVCLGVEYQYCFVIDATSLDCTSNYKATQPTSLAGETQMLSLMNGTLTRKFILDIVDLRHFYH